MIDPFKKISEDDKRILLKKLEASTYDFQKNVSILSTVKANAMIGIVISGCVQIVRTDYDGNRIITEELTDNAVFGTTISSLTDNEYEMITKNESKIIVLDYFAITNYHRSEDSFYNQFILNLLEITMSIISTRNERIEILTKKTIRNRLLEYFKIMSTKNHSRIIYLPFSYTDLADYLAVDRSAMSREIKSLKEEGIIDVKARKITLHYSSYPARK